MQIFQFVEIMNKKQKKAINKWCLELKINFEKSAVMKINKQISAMKEINCEAWAVSQVT